MEETNENLSELLAAIQREEDVEKKWALIRRLPPPQYEVDIDEFNRAFAGRPEQQETVLKQLASHGGVVLTSSTWPKPDYNRLYPIEIVGDDEAIQDFIKNLPHPPRKRIRFQGMEGDHAEEGLTRRIPTPPAKINAKEPPGMRGRQCDPRAWRNFRYEKTPSKFLKLLVSKVVSFSVPANRTNRDVVEEIAKQSKIPIESLPNELSQPVFSRGQAIFGFVGDEIDKIANNYDHMEWWLSEVGLNMVVVSPADKNSPILSFDDLMGGHPADRKEADRNGRKSASRNPRYKKIDLALKDIAQSRPATQREIFESLDARRVEFPPAEPFASARGWIAGFERKGEPRARGSRSDGHY